MEDDTIYEDLWDTAFEVEQKLKEQYLSDWDEAIEYDKLIAQVVASHVADYDGSRRKYADSVSTSEALRKRVMIERAKRNGHGGE